MANVVHQQIDFHPHRGHHASSPFGFPFGLSPANAPSPPACPTSFPPIMAASPMMHHQQQQPTRPAKRRLEVDESLPAKSSRRSDDAMDRSPTPERPKRAAPKRARVVQESDDRNGKENRPPAAAGNDDVDFGVLLASLPPQSLLPILTSLLESHPSLKASVLPLIPRPTLDTALEALNRSAKKLRDAYPYSSAPAFGNSQPFSQAPSFGTRTSGIGFGFGKPANTIQPSFGYGIGQTTLSVNHNPSSSGHMRDTYIMSRLDTHITEFVAACMSYLPYFSYATNPEQSSNPSATEHATQSHSSALQNLHKEKFHPSETYSFLAALTNHLFTQPPLTQKCLAPSLMPRLLSEWRAWIDKVDDAVNKRGGMFGSETVKSWEAGLDQFAAIMSDPEGAYVMQEIRDNWVARVGWLVGRRLQHAMDE